MSEFEDLPEGITINKTNVEFSIDLEYELIDSINCKKCNISYQMLLLTYASRHEGKVVIQPLNSTVWKNFLSKDKEKAVKNLRVALMQKFDRHKERCNND